MGWSDKPEGVSLSNGLYKIFITIQIQGKKEESEGGRKGKGSTLAMWWACARVGEGYRSNKIKSLPLMQEESNNKKN